MLGVLGKKTDKPATEKARRNPDSELASGPRSGSSDSDEGLVSGAESPNEKNGSEKKGPTRSHSEGEADGVIRQEPTLLSNTANVNAAN